MQALLRVGRTTQLRQRQQSAPAAKCADHNFFAPAARQYRDPEIEPVRIFSVDVAVLWKTSFADVEKALSSDIHSDDYVKGVVVLAADFHG